MKRMIACFSCLALLVVANVGFGQASRPPRVQDKAFHWDPTVGAYVRDVRRNLGVDRFPGLGDASPVDIIDNRSIEQFTRAFDTDQTNSRIDDYINQDDQLNIDAETGVVKVLRVNQKRLVNDYVTALVPLRNVTPREMRGVFRNVCGKEGGWADVLQDKVTGENFLQVICPEFQLPYVVNSLHALDQEWVKENYDGRFHAFYKPKFRSGQQMINVMQFFRGPMETFVWDEEHNAIQFTGQGAVVNGLFPYGTNMTDIPPSQVKLEVAIYEVNVKNDLKLGLDWVAWKNGPGRDLFEGVVAGGPSYIGHFRWVNLHAVVTTAYLDFLASKGKARLVTRQSLTAKTGSIAELAAVDEVLALDVTHNPDQSLYLHTNYTTPPIATYAPTPPAPFIQPVGAPSALIPDAQLDAILAPEDAVIPVFHQRALNYVNAGTVGTFLWVLPFVGLETSELAISLHTTDFDGYTPQGDPLFNHRFIDSYVRIRDGSPFVLAGLKREETVKSKNGIPWLSELPVVGWLTGGETNSKRNTEVVVVITPYFDVSSESKIESVESKIEMNADEYAAKQYVLGQTSMPLPKNSFGFDQWLLDKLDR